MRTHRNLSRTGPRNRKTSVQPSPLSHRVRCITTKIITLRFSPKLVIALVATSTSKDSTVNSTTGSINMLVDTGPSGHYLDDQLIPGIRGWMRLQRAGDSARDHRGRRTPSTRNCHGKGSRDHHWEERQEAQNEDSRPHRVTRRHLRIFPQTRTKEGRSYGHRPASSSTPSQGGICPLRRPQIHIRKSWPKNGDGHMAKKQAFQRLGVLHVDWRYYIIDRSDCSPS